MFWQSEYIRENVAQTLNDTYKLDLPKAGMLGSILIRISGNQKTGLGQDGGAWRLIDFISKVTILINGSEVCKSVTGKQLQAGAFFDQGVLPPGDWRNYATNTQFEYLLINLGRWFKDTDFGLDLAKYNNVEIQIENNMAASEFTGLTYSLLGYYLRDANAGQFRGYMRTEEWKRWTTVADETQYHILPVKYRIRRVMLQAIPNVDASYVDTTGMSNLMDDIDFSLDTGNTRVYKGGLDDLMRDNYLDLGRPMIVGASPYMNADKGIDVSIGRIIGYANGAGSQSGAIADSIATLESARTNGILKPENYDADNPMNVIAFGFAPFSIAMFNFDTNYDPSMWLDPDQRKNVLLNIHTRNSSSAAGGTNAVILDRLVTD